MKSTVIPSPIPDKSKFERTSRIRQIFLGTQQRRGDNDNDEETALPCVRNSDRQYRPPGAYLLQGDPELVDAKRAWRLSLGVQLDEKAEALPVSIYLFALSLNLTVQASP
jgi:hypothetical protein